MLSPKKPKKNPTYRQTRQFTTGKGVSELCLVNPTTLYARFWNEKCTRFGIKNMQDYTRAMQFVIAFFFFFLGKPDIIKLGDTDRLCQAQEEYLYCIW